MTNENIELSKEGIKISYLRYLSDSAIGICFFMYFLIIYYGTILNVLKLHNIQIGSEEKLVIFFIGFLLSLPIGLMVNAISWYLFGTLLYYLGYFWIKINSFIEKASKIDGIYNDTKSLFKFEYNTFYFGAHYLDGLFESYGLNIPDITHIKGVKRFARNILLFLIFVSINHQQYAFHSLMLASLILLLVTLLELETNLRVYKFGYYLLINRFDIIKDIDEQLGINESKLDIKTFKIRLEKISIYIINDSKNKATS